MRAARVVAETALDNALRQHGYTTGAVVEDGEVRFEVKKVVKLGARANAPGLLQSAVGQLGGPREGVHLAARQRRAAALHGERPVRPLWVEQHLVLPRCCPSRRRCRRGRLGPCAPTRAAAARSTIMTESIGAAAAVAPPSTLPVELLDVGAS